MAKKIEMTPKRWEGLLKAAAEDNDISVEELKAGLAVVYHPGPMVAPAGPKANVDYLLCIGKQEHLDQWNEWHPTQEWSNGENSS